MNHSLLRMLIAALPVFILDRVSKIWVIESLNLPEVFRIEIFPPYLNFVMAWNRGVNFGLFGSDSDITRWVLIALALAICTGLLVWSFRTRGWLLPLAIGLVIGGALGNVWDRFQYGAVADFLNMSCCGFTNPYAFNIADISIFLGGVALILFAGDDKRA